MQVSEIDEFKLINRLSNLVKSNSSKIELGIGDDGAVINNQNDQQTIITTDMLIEGTHFLKDKVSPFQLGYKSLAVNISDIVAMGGRPTYLTISLGLPKSTTVKYIEDIYNGINNLAQEYKISVIGGDTTSSPNDLIININLLGEVPKGEYISRSNAQVGDSILVTGNLGASKAGLEILLSANYQKLKEEYPYLINKHLEPQPRLSEMQLVKKQFNITSMNDISDGLASELHEITSASKVGALIYEEMIPISHSTKELAQNLNKSTLDYALFGGEDYELLFTTPASQSQKVKEKIETELDTQISIIGEITTLDKGINLIKEDGKVKVKKQGYNHF
ncbi:MULTISPECIES: thiamine-phosphate kinase [unclassified Candidatus Frackibacter]|uniref:thiamine-phosphate kinase n=1 Tax=unclassified Candidatus Frackibacter TaxID=2648818 RepID=UPI00088A240D|nr:MULTISPECIES: thiamine-phosphate kinase [unclassified Candidatus Frackibacter]SDC54246.1 thiamine-phosphate kinase [Candidatus Frackibacter sp. WG11]SEM66457.1 thiamine-phosphate kinase [Candidatus Frackibacter sp. WG12]SFL77810.1 thiamine-phosphate kinase [Candidatus Frackibacter sp. WG13]